MIALYVRVSTHEQAENGYSIDEQIDRLVAYCNALGYDSYKVYKDPGFSGATTDRPALQNLINDVKLHHVHKVLVYKLDRLSRSQVDTLNLIENVFLKNDCDFNSISENFDTATPFGRAMIGILAVFAQLEREQIKERLSMGKIARAKKGLYKGGGLAPIGYDFIDSRLVVNESEREQVQLIYDMFESGGTYRGIVKFMNDNGYQHKYGQWHRNTLTNVLQNPIYTGTMIYNGETYEGIHEPIISQRQFDNVQSIIKRRKGQRQDNRASLLGNILVCGRCGAKLHAHRYNVGYDYYWCDNKRQCHNRSYRIDKLDTIILDEIRKLKIDPEFKPSLKSNHTDTKRINEQIARIDSKIARMIDLYGLENVPIDILENKLNELNEQKRNLINQLNRVPDKLDIEQVNNLLIDFQTLVDTAEMKPIVNLLIDRIILEDDTIKIEWNF
jgi:site-specific DNA recombinase